MQSAPVMSHSSSFNCCSSVKFSDIAPKTVGESIEISESKFDDAFSFQIQEKRSDKSPDLPGIEDKVGEVKRSENVVESSRVSESESGDVFSFQIQEKQSDGTLDLPRIEDEEEVKQSKHEEDDDFEFPSVRRELESFAISADEIFCNGLIRPIFPPFKSGLWFDNPSLVSSNAGTPARIPLGKLLFRDCVPPAPESNDDLAGVQPGTYCIWTPRSAAESPARCKKSNSTGSSTKRWKFRDLLRRCNSDGDDTVVFVATPNGNAKKKKAQAAVKAPPADTPAGEES
ncbi:hypothetical protein NMG60_11019337 [Bertholletia excelsa]